MPHSEDSSGIITAHAKAEYSSSAASSTTPANSTTSTVTAVLWAPVGPLDDTAILLAKVAAGLFALLAIAAVRTFILSGRKRGGGGATPAPVAAGMRMRRCLIMGLLIANFARVFSLIAEIVFGTADAAGNHSCEGLENWLFDCDNDRFWWALDLLEILPACVFLSTFSIILLFWAQLHYITTMVPQPLLECIVLCVNVGAYVLFVAIAVCTFVMKAYNHFRTYATCFVGLMSILIAFPLLYYGLSVASELNETAKKKMHDKRIVLRVRVLSVVCTGVFLLRGACDLAWGTLAMRQDHSKEILLCLASEWLPCLLTLVVLSPWESTSLKAHQAALEDSTDSEAPLLPDDEPAISKSLPGAPGPSWSQVYPQPVDPTSVSSGGGTA